MLTWKSFKTNSLAWPYAFTNMSLENFHLNSFLRHQDFNSGRLNITSEIVKMKPSRITIPYGKLE